MRISMLYMLLATWLLSTGIVNASNNRILLLGAQQQIGKTLLYDPAYQQLSYPKGDVPLIRGVCTDVVIRALRHAGQDLQQLVHEDMRQNFQQYPQQWGLKSTDRNIDHRRVPNLTTYFTRHHQSLTPSQKPANYRPGDIVSWRLPSNLPHIGIVSDKKNARGVPLIIHNITAGAQQEDVLFRWEITGHYRFFKS